MKYLYFETQDNGSFILPCQETTLSANGGRITIRNGAQAYDDFISTSVLYFADHEQAFRHLVRQNDRQKAAPSKREEPKSTRAGGSK